MFQLPIEVQRIIFSFDNTYKKKFNKVLTEFNNKIHELDFYEIIYNKISELNESLDGEEDEEYIDILTYNLKYLKLELILSINSESDGGYMDPFNEIFNEYAYDAHMNYQNNTENQEGPNYYDDGDDEYVQFLSK